MEDLLQKLEQEMERERGLVKAGQIFSLDVPVPISIIVIHVSPHLDEVAARFVAVRYGGNKFPGIESAKVQYTRSELRGSESGYWTKGTLPIGTGDGFIFNDHIVSAKDLTISHTSNDCACTLVAKYLRVHRQPELQQLLREVLACDRSANTTPTMLASIIKTDNSRRDWLDNSQASRLIKATIAHSDAALAAIVEYEMAPVGLREGEKTLTDFYRAWLEAREMNEGKLEERIRAYLNDVVERSMEAKDRTVTELAHIVEAMARTARQDESIDSVNERIADWLEYAFEAMLIDQMDFWKEVDRIRKMQPVGVKALIGGTDDVLRMAIVRNGSYNSQKAARYCHNDIVVTVSRRGGHGIFLSEKAKSVGIADLVPMVRILESHARSDGRVFKRWEWVTLARAGIHAAASNWYYFREAEMLFNGSNTTEAEPSKVPFIRIVTAIRHAFHPDLVEIWKEREFQASRRMRA